MTVGGVEMHNRKPQSVREGEEGFSDMYCRKEQKPLVAPDFGMLMIRSLTIFGSNSLLLLEDVKSPQAHELIGRSMLPIYSVEAE